LGRIVQKRLVRKLDLEVLLSRINSHPTPRPDLEQYTIPANVAATMLFIAAYANDDVIGKRVLDLGCGTGRLALGAAFLGARSVVGVDIDKSAVKVAFENSADLGLKEKVQWVISDIDAVCENFDTVLQNPPYGVQARKADRRFLEKALETGKRVYSLHKSLQNEKPFVKSLKANPNGFVPVPPSPFLKKFIEERGGRIEAVYAMLMMIPRMFDFHTKKKHQFAVDLYVIDGGSKTG
jgi:putative methylase